MNPSNDNPFGSLSSGGPAGGVGSGSPDSGGMVGGVSSGSVGNPGVGNSGIFGAGGTNPNMVASGGKVPISSVGGDIILNNDAGNEQKKRTLILVIIISFIVLLIGVVVLVLALSGGFGGVLANEKTSFNRYANYLLYGEEKDEEVIEHDEGDEEYYFLQQADSGEISREYIEQLKRLYAAFYEKYKRDGYENEYLETIVEQHNAQLKLITTYYTEGPLLRSSVLDAYLSGGDEEVNNYIYDVAEPYADIPEIYDISYYGLVKEWGEKTLALIKEYNKIGCIESSEINYECVANNNNNNSTISDLSKDLSNNSYYREYMIEHGRNDVIEDAFLISGAINDLEKGEDEEQL